ncbi:SpoIIAA family protein [Algoriphagus aquimarinus]|uniref:SpoIIAA-like n=1 Tax=Algoriphagus aquimarinus TaxID=237018 RepID=A0A1I0X9X5_9BACT|nr:STAS/SEC14 domain-containing protein [Algoriphagus aquimarinus]SFA97694.1 SpoIIAA-like [Algoriphagus aquimarinus]|tara:strand:+ start:20190 stop:20543 length:354 start_codon:yes stop_codon:yes gene_type:complete
MEVNYSQEKGLISYVINGEITVDDMRQLQEARNQLATISALKVLAIVTSFKGYKSFKAMKDALLGDWRMLPRLSKYAMLTDSTWLRALIFILNLLVLKSELKAFPLRDRKLADRWLE